MVAESPGTGWLDGAERCLSPNCNERPVGEEVNLLVIHNISLPPGEFGGSCIREFFCNELDCDAHPYFDQLRDMEVSSHLLIERDGHVVQFVPFGLRAWHAGQSSFQGRENCNDFSIGIELEGTDDGAYTDAQYSSLAAVTRELQHRYPAITAQRITGHSDIAPGRKTDPGPAFDWPRYMNLLSGAKTQL
jgi:AmpD protein